MLTLKYAHSYVKTDNQGTRNRNQLTKQKAIVNKLI